MPCRASTAASSTAWPGFSSPPSPLSTATRWAVARSSPSPATYLASHAIAAVLDKAPELDRARIDEVVWGNANGAGEENRNVGRMAGLLAGLPVSVPGTTVNRLCGSGLDAAMVASRQIETGDAEIVLAGGVESMTRAPWVLPKSDRPYPAGDVTAVSTTLGWRLVNDRMPAEWTVSLGEANEQLGEKLGISRARQDEFASRSHELAHQAWESGFYDDLVSPVPGTGLTRDEEHPLNHHRRGAEACDPCSVRTAPSPRATPAHSTTAPPRCSSAQTGPLSP
ncbi:3-ketoacyl-CoA thiolase [Streptomyces antimycoticus]